jgi:hypothetical protein
VHVRYKAAIYDQSIDARPMSQLNQPTEGFHLYTPDFRLAPKPVLDFFKLGWMNARRQITGAYCFLKRRFSTHPTAPF